MSGGKISSLPKHRRAFTSIPWSCWDAALPDEGRTKAHKVSKSGARAVSPLPGTLLALLKETEPRAGIISPGPSCHHLCPRHARKDILRNSLERLLCLFFSSISTAGHGACSAAQEADGERKIKLMHVAPVKLPKIAFPYIKLVMKLLTFILGAVHNENHIPSLGYFPFSTKDFSAFVPLGRIWRVQTSRAMTNANKGIIGPEWSIREGNTLLERAM